MVYFMKTKVIFLDRDGVINMERGGYTYRLEDFELTPGLLEALKILQQKGYLFIIISNQGGVAKGLYSHLEIEQLNEFLKKEFDSFGIKWTDFYYCPHHPQFNGNCLCRKPDSLLFERAIAKHEIDVSKSYMIGDKKRDILAAEKLNIKGFLIEANTSLKNLLPLFP